MKIINLVSPILGTNCYLIIFNTKAIIIDPSVEYDLILKNLDDCKLEGIFLTHGHADHFSFLEDIYKHEKVNLYMHENAKEKLINSYKNGSELFNYPLTFNDLEKVIEVDDNQIIEIDGCLIKVITTPGHTNCSVCYLIENHLFSGDTLFYRTVGRTDLYSSSYIDLQNSLSKLKKLEIDYNVYPGHGRKTTLFDEVKNNKYFDY